MTESRLVLKRVKTGEEYPLAGVVPVGREVANGIKLTAEGASRRHATLSVVDGTVYLEDAGSRNGTTLNSRPVTAKTALKSGDRVSFDTEEFEFVAPAADATVVHVSNADKGSPRSWAEVEFNVQGTDGTERFDANQLKEYLAKAKQRQEKHTQVEIKEPCLRILSGNQAERVLALHVDGGARQEWTIGRSADSSIRLEEPGVSERHSKIVREGAQWKLLDAISSNGSFVNDLQIGMCYLASGDTLRFGRVECMFNLPTRDTRSRQAPGGRNGSKMTVIAAIGVSFVVTLAVLFWLFHAHLL
jgi:pSer/pThr/pTyr-binding forkhead associated (FHA) protein